MWEKVLVCLEGETYVFKNKAYAFFKKMCFLQQQHNLQMEQLIWPSCWLLKSLFYIKLSLEGCIFQCCYDHQPFL